MLGKKLMFNDVQHHDFQIKNPAAPLASFPWQNFSGPKIQIECERTITTTARDTTALTIRDDTQKKTHKSQY